RTGGGWQAPPLAPAPESDARAPLSFAQQRLWLVQQLEPRSAAYNMAFALRVRGRMDPGVLEAAVSEIVRRHETLRTTFAASDGEPVQVIHPPAPVVVPRTELRALPPALREREARRLAGEEALRPFDLAAGPLLRVRALRLDGEEWALLFTLHHVVGDGWSLGVFVRELSELYGALSEGRAPELPPLPVQYADYAVWQRGWLSGAVLEAQLAYWRERLRGAPPLLELPTDRPRLPAGGDRGAVRPIARAGGTADALRALARREGATLFMALLAGWQLLLSRWSGQDDVCVGTPVAGRTRVETEGLIGFFVNTLVMRADLSGDPGFAGLLRQVREAALGAYAHQDVPFERLVEELAPERSPGRSPLFQVVFSLRTLETGALRMGGAQVEPLARDAEPARFDLSLTLFDGEDGGLGGTLLFRTDLFEGATAERMLGHYANLLHALAADPSAPVAHADMLSAAERAQVLREWNDTAAALPRDRCVHELVAEQAARTPHAPAVVFRDRTLAYAELVRDADRLARRLHAAGVRVDGRVGILLERGDALVVAVLGILRAGAGYLALDPGNPDERLRFMLADAGATALVTTPELAARLAGFEGAVVYPGEGEHGDDTPDGGDRQR
ncbi:MAG TPA: condensation domain-containing protein, partial [Longimicrobiaceae bacterium]|nr:condensation domain-containing protein [Longimicrobiaceae bacterium]